MPSTWAAAASNTTRHDLARAVMEGLAFNNRWTREAVGYARSKQGEPAQSSALYGIAGTVEGNRMVNDLLCGVFDYMYDI